MKAPGPRPDFDFFLRQQAEGSGSGNIVAVPLLYRSLRKIQGPAVQKEASGSFQENNWKVRPYLASAFASPVSPFGPRIPGFWTLTTNQARPKAAVPGMLQDLATEKERGSSRKECSKLQGRKRAREGLARERAERSSRNAGYVQEGSYGTLHRYSICLFWKADREIFLESRQGNQTSGGTGGVAGGKCYLLAPQRAINTYVATRKYQNRNA